ncbi:MAG: hypothetical protein K6G81_01620 [Lachnospiraceae bacterium]|nr:hypothetical protein [Lachnospiraceae bacterium]
MKDYQDLDPIKSNMEQLVTDAFNEGYDQGAEDSWEAAKRINHVWYYVVYQDANKMADYFGLNAKPGDGVFDKIFELQPQEVIKKIRQHDAEQNEIEIGDEVVNPWGTVGFIVDRCVQFDNITVVYTVMWKSKETGRTMFGDWESANTRKTGRHNAVLEELLKSM